MIKYRLYYNDIVRVGPDVMIRVDKVGERAVKIVIAAPRHRRVERMAGCPKARDLMLKITAQKPPDPRPPARRLGIFAGLGLPNPKRRARQGV